MRNMSGLVNFDLTRYGISVSKETMNLFYIDNDPKLAARVEPLEQVIDSLTDQIKDNHIVRLQKGLCSIHMGFVLSDLLTDFERVSDHCSNVAVTIIELAQKGGNLESHGYLNSVKKGGKEFQTMFEDYEAKYKLQA